MLERAHGQHRSLPSSIEPDDMAAASSVDVGFDIYIVSRGAGLFHEK
jgi:hypothetical protein